MGPACADKKVLIAMVKEGLDVARLNFSHSDHGTHETFLNLIREINAELGTNIAILQDLQGPKIRIGDLEAPVKVKKGDIVTLCSTPDVKQNGVLPIVYDTFAVDVNEGDLILIDDGKVELTVVSTNRKDKVKLRIEAGDLIQSRKGVNLPMTKISAPTVTEKDYHDIDFAIKHDVEWLALSFVRTADDIRFLKELIRLKNGTSRIIAKIEKPEALVNIDEIIAASDGIMVARGDLGVEIPLEEVPMWQKRIIKKCNQAAKPVILATQVMESMIQNKRPTRAEASDVANALVDGADAVMLSAETSVGRYPLDVVSAMNRILRRVEREDDTLYYKNMELTPEMDNPLNSAVIASACTLARETRADAIVGMTRSGYTALQLSHCRPKAHIYVFTDNRNILNMLNLVWGIKAFYYDGQVSTDQTIHDIHEILKDKDMLEPGDVIVNTGSMPLHEHGLTNMIKISRVKPKGL
jgi:pyruvate kinase